VHPAVKVARIAGTSRHSRLETELRFEFVVEINLLEYSVRMIETGYNVLYQVGSMIAEDLAELTSDVGLDARKGHLLPYQTTHNLGPLLAYKMNV